MIQKPGKWLPELLVILVCMIALGVGVSSKEGYHMDELLSFELANAEFNPWIVPTQPEGRLAKFVRNEIEGEGFGETLGNLVDTVKDVLENKGSSKLLSYKADVYEEPVWISAKQFQDYITVDEGDDFHYLSVYFNVKDDNHPPVHFALLHTMSSLFQGKIAPVMGCVINLAAVAISMFFLMRIGILLAELLEKAGIWGMRDRGWLLGLFVAFLYGSSTGAMASVLLIRMYCVMTCFCVMLFYYHLKKWQQEGGFLKANKAMITVTVLGFLTQYFFLFYCLILAAVTAALLFVYNRRKELLIYIRSMVCAAIIGVGCFPFAILDVFSSGRGVEALENLASGLSGYGSRLSSFFSIMSDRCFDGWLVKLLVIMVLVKLVFQWKRRKMVEGKQADGAIEELQYRGEAVINAEEKRSGIKNADIAEIEGRKRCLMCLPMLVLPVIGYFLLAARMAPYLVDRYIMPIFPFVMLIGAVTAVVLALKIEHQFQEKNIVYVVCGILIGVQLVNLAAYDGTYQYRGYQEQEQVALEYEALPCICVYDGVGYYENLLEFTHYEKTLLVTEAELAEREDVESVSQLQQAVVLMKQNVDWQQVFGLLQEKYGLTFQEELLADSVYGDRVCLFVKE